MASGRGCPGAPPCPGRPELVVSGWPRAAGKKPGLNSPPRGGSGVYSNRSGSQNGNPGQLLITVTKDSRFRREFKKQAGRAGKGLYVPFVISGPKGREPRELLSLAARPAQ